MKTTIIDVREPEEYQAGHVSGSINIPLGQIHQGSPILDRIKKDSKIVVYCRSGGRSDAARDQLSSLGFNNVTNGINKNNVENM